MDQRCEVCGAAGATFVTDRDLSTGHQIARLLCDYHAQFLALGRPLPKSPRVFQQAAAETASAMLPSLRAFLSFLQSEGRHPTQTESQEQSFADLRSQASRSLGTRSTPGAGNPGVSTNVRTAVVVEAPKPAIRPLLIPVLTGGGWGIRPLFVRAGFRRRLPNPGDRSACARRRCRW
jgi:hypothetical protein